MNRKYGTNYKQIIQTLKESERFEYPISPEITNQFKGMDDYDKNSGLIGVCHFFGTFIWQIRMSFDTFYRPFIQEHCIIKTSRDEAVLRLLHLVLKHAKQLFSDYDEAVLRILNKSEKHD